jgi:hypothetical protein
MVNAAIGVSLAGPKKPHVERCVKHAFNAQTADCRRSCPCAALRPGAGFSGVGAGASVCSRGGGAGACSGRRRRVFRIAARPAYSRSQGGRARRLPNRGAPGFPDCGAPRLFPVAGGAGAPPSHHNRGAVTSNVADLYGRRTGSTSDPQLTTNVPFKPQCCALVPPLYRPCCSRVHLLLYPGRPGPSSSSSSSSPRSSVRRPIRPGDPSSSDRSGRPAPVPPSCPRFGRLHARASKGGGYPTLARHPFCPPRATDGPSRPFLTPAILPAFQPDPAPWPAFRVLFHSREKRILTSKRRSRAHGTTKTGVAGLAYKDRKRLSK